MALVFMDSFAHYTTLLQKYSWTQGGVAIGATGRNGGSALRTYGTWDQCGGLRSFALPASSTYIAGFAYKLATPSGGGGFSVSPLFSFQESGGVHVNLQIDFTTLIPSLARNGTILATSSVALITGTFNFIEIKAVIHDTAGSVELRINGMTVATATGVDTRNGGTGVINQIQLGSGWQGGGIGADQYFADLYVCDGSGAVNNSFLGDCRVECLFPSGAGAETQWTPLTGANWQNVDETPPDDDTSYNESNTVGQVDTYTMADLVSTTGVIYGVQKLNYVRKDNAGSRSVAPVLRIGGTDHVGASTSIGDSYVYTHEIEEVSPATLSAFTIAEVNAIEVGVQVTA